MIIYLSKGQQIVSGKGQIGNSLGFTGQRVAGSNAQLCHHSACGHAQLCLTLFDPVDCSLPGSSVRGIFQARVLEWVAISFSRGSSQPRD